MQQLDLPVLDSGNKPPKAFVKHDAGKPRFDLLDADFLQGMAVVMTDGAIKYADNNWKLCEQPMQRYYAALQRHLNAFAQGESRDPDTLMSHLYHAACCVMFLSWFEKNGGL